MEHDTDHTVMMSPHLQRRHSAVDLRSKYVPAGGRLDDDEDCCHGQHLMSFAVDPVRPRSSSLPLFTPSSFICAPFAPFLALSKSHEPTLPSENPTMFQNPEAPGSRDNNHSTCPSSAGAAASNEDEESHITLRLPRPTRRLQGPKDCSQISWLSTGLEKKSECTTRCATCSARPTRRAASMGGQP